MNTRLDISNLSPHVAAKAAAYTVALIAHPNVDEISVRTFLEDPEPGTLGAEPVIECVTNEGIRHSFHISTDGGFCLTDVVLRIDHIMSPEGETLHTC